MPFNIITKAGEKCLLLTLNGETTKDNMIDLADEIFKLCQSLDMSIAIIDCAGMKGGVSVGELMKVGEYFSEKTERESECFCL